MTIFQGFSDADAPWIPELIDIESLKRSEDGAYYQQFGWEKLEVPEECPIVASRMEYLKIRFDERYANRMLNSETLERWQVRLQNRFDEVVDRYERAYELYQRYDEQMKTDVITGEKIVVTGSTQASGSDTTSNTSDSRSSETPDLRLNESDDYASSISKGSSSGSVNYGRKDTVDTTTERTVMGRELMRGVNDSIDDWKDIDTEFIGEFENNFLNVFWY